MAMKSAMRRTQSEPEDLVSQTCSSHAAPQKTTGTGDEIHHDLLQGMGTTKISKILTTLLRTKRGFGDSFVRS